MLRLAKKVRTPEELAVEKIMQETQTLVRTEAVQGGTQTHVEVPAIVPGCPAYDYRAVCRAVQIEYEKGGFTVDVQGLGQFVVSWGETQTDLDDDDTQSEVVRVVYS